MVRRRRGVYWCRNVGTKRVPKFGPPQLLVADNDRWQTTGICVADWNGDGRPDLIASRIEDTRRRERTPLAPEGVGLPSPRWLKTRISPGRTNG